MKLTGLLERAKELKGLSREELIELLSTEDQLGLTELFEAAGGLKEIIFGKAISIFAPLYLSNECVNNCLYCGFRVDNRLLKRKTLTLEEIIEQAEVLSGQGHKRVILVSAENPRAVSAEKVAHIVNEIYQKTPLKTITVNMAPLSVEEFKTLTSSHIWAYQSFQETYSEEAYGELHPKAKKADYHWRLSTMERALSAGIRQVGMGVLFGLYDYKFEVLALYNHINRLKEKFGIYPYNISVPRLRPALGAVLRQSPYPVSDTEIKKVVVALRLAFPKVHIALSTREPKGLRDEMAKIGITQISAGSKTSPGGYTETGPDLEGSQFEIEDTRSTEEVMRDLKAMGLDPKVDYEAEK